MARTVGDDLEELEERILTYEDFASEHGITMTCEQIATPPNRRDWGAGSTHWKCHLKRGKKKMQITFSMGSALKHSPKIKDVLYSIAADASSYESAGGDYHSFLEEFGYEDEAEQRRTWASLKKQNASLMRLLDDDQDLYNALLYNTREEYER